MKLYYLECDDLDGQGWYKAFHKPDYLSELRKHVQGLHYASLRDIDEFGMDTHANYRAVSVDGTEVVTLWEV